MTAQLVVDGLGLSRIHGDEGGGDEAAVGEAGSAAFGVGCPGGSAQGTCRPGTPARGLAVTGLIALGERDGAVRDAERRAVEALRTMTDDEGLSAGEAADWCGSGVTTREVTRLRRLQYYPQRVGGRQAQDRSTSSV